jgi:di/tricarboxylate transporter
MDTFLFLGFGLDAWITIVTVLGMFSVLLFTKLRSDWVFLGAIGVLFVTGVLDAKEAFSGFSSTSVVTVGVLFVVVAGLMHTGVLHCMVRFLLGQPGSYRFSDFMRIGLLMNLIILAANIFIVNIVYPLTPL